MMLFFSFDDDRIDNESTSFGGRNTKNELGCGKKSLRIAQNVKRSSKRKIEGRGGVPGGGERCVRRRREVRRGGKMLMGGWRHHRPPARPLTLHGDGTPGGGGEATFNTVSDTDTIS